MLPFPFAVVGPEARVFPPVAAKPGVAPLSRPVPHRFPPSAPAPATAAPAYAR